jgi:SPP1 gp7 family putative phage head morphogenesis protein
LAFKFFRQSPEGEEVKPLGLTATQKRIAKLYFNDACCDHTHNTYKLASEIASPIIEDFLLAIYQAKLEGKELHSGMYQQTADKLMAGVMAQLSPGNFSYDEAQNALNQYIRRNIFAFSAAKNFSQQKALSLLLTDGTGKIKPFSQFKKDAASVVDQYNKQWLEAEYNNAIASAQMAVKWNDFVTSGTEYLEYSTAGDANVRDSHAALEGLTLPITSPQWQRIYPPNDWNCRCTVIPGVANKASNAEDAARKADSVAKGYFDNNVGLTGIVFKEGKNNAHPYFLDVKGNIDELHPVKNYNLKIPDAKYLKPMHQDSVADAVKWWQRSVADYGIGSNNLAFKDVLGNELKIEGSMFAQHNLARNLFDVLKQPDEVFCRMDGKNLQTVYVKYYKQAPVMLITENNKKEITATKLFKYSMKTSAEYKSKRKGVLLYKANRQ